MKKFRAMWQSLWVDVDRRVRLGRILGLAFLVAGFVVMGKAWDGAASQARVDSQFPYLLSGGFMGLGLVITGCTLLMLSTIRSERQVQSKQFEDVTTLLSRNLGRLSISSTNGSGANTEQVIAGTDAYHRTDCKVLRGKEGLTSITVAQAASEGLEPCRSCEPPQPAEIAKESQSAN